MYYQYALSMESLVTEVSLGYTFIIMSIGKGLKRRGHATKNVIMHTCPYLYQNRNSPKESIST